MLGGVEITQRARAHALEMLSAASASDSAPDTGTEPERRRSARVSAKKNAGG